nr:immunoglobulin heavy chain junction region [Mus musculus]
CPRPPGYYFDFW